MSTLKTTNIQHPSAGSPAVELTAAGGLWLGGGKVLQVVRATDSSTRSTTSTSFVDASISTSITPQKATSAVLLIWIAQVEFQASNNYMNLQITDASNNPIAGAEDSLWGSSADTNPNGLQTIIGYATPATTSAVTYKGRFKVNSTGTARLRNTVATGQLYALEISA